MRNLFILVVVVTVIVVAKLLIKNVDYSQSVKYVENHFNLYDNNNKSTDIVNSSYVVNNTTPLVLKEKADESVAEVLKQRVRVLIWVMTSPKNLHKARAVKNTWGSRCDLLLFFSSENNTELPTIELDVEEGREHLYEKTTQAFDYIYENYFDMADWFMKVDDDTFVIVENLRHFLHDKNASEPVFTGLKFKIVVKVFFFQNFQSGGAGYVLSKEALRRFATRELSPPVCTNHTTDEDVELARCLHRLNVTILNSTDDKLRTRFHLFNMEKHLGKGPPKGHLPYEPNPVKWGIDGINEHAISFHYITPEQMFSSYYCIYHSLHGHEDDMVQSRRTPHFIGKWTKVCSRHFVPEDFRPLSLKGKRRRLKPDAVPSLFTWNNFQRGKERKQPAVRHPLSLANVNTNQSKNGDAKPTTEPATAETEPATAAAEL
ncbi:hypothetical protein C0Q70_07708 [Pomacea canaliculata]|uniref:N-acetylgalactosaminide beta-1,3-galactosyltransferase n=1 Tax=Pomacea canaliculata TaxID=400727 RepID=A0A2T7PFS4_POMCA|nr:hypothetical protein C0Q70_07708 [Pomacea canaliculata]